MKRTIQSYKLSEFTVTRIKWPMYTEILHTAFYKGELRIWLEHRLPVEPDERDLATFMVIATHATVPDDFHHVSSLSNGLIMMHVYANFVDFFI